jgi:3-hydroxybutyryl-CoA dehydrogenase
MRAKKTGLDPVGLVGLGLMGRGIAACLLARGLRVVAHDRVASRAKQAVGHIDATLREMIARRLLTKTQARDWQQRFQTVTSIGGLAASPFVIESVREDIAVKRQVYDELEGALGRQAVIASNTSSLPITQLQAGRRHPARIIGMHWGEPAQIMRYLEVTPGVRTSPATVKTTVRLGELCGKEPTVLNKDVQGFISNRIMYAMIREACHLVESGVADIPAVDRSFRNDIGYWATLAGPFRWMDLTGIPAYEAVMQGLLPKLSNAKKVPKMMTAMVASGALGVSNAKGFYPYTRAGARRWEKAWTDFTYEIRALADKYTPRSL